MSSNKHYENEIYLRIQSKFFMSNSSEKVEQTSYPVPPPSVLEGVLGAIYTKPEFIWLITDVYVETEFKNQCYVYNGVNKLSKKPFNPLENRFQYSKNIIIPEQDKYLSYVIRAEIYALTNQDIQKHLNVFHKRIEKGEVFSFPVVLGKTGCPLYDYYLVKKEEIKPISLSGELGHMSHFSFKDENKNKVFSYFSAIIEKGQIKIPEKKISKYIRYFKKVFI